MSRVTIMDKEAFRQSIQAVVNELIHTQRIPRADAHAYLLEQLGLSTASRPTLTEVWTQASRLKTVSTVESQYLYGMAWIGFHVLNRDPIWLESLFRSTSVGLEYPLINVENRSVVKALFRKARLNGTQLAEDVVEEALDRIFGLDYHTVNATNPEVAPGDYGFQINRIYVDAANHLYMELCGVTRTPLLFAVRNEETGFTWQSLGRRLVGPCQVYRVIYGIAAPGIWYSIDIVGHDETYGAHVRVLISASTPYYCADVRIEGPGLNFTRRIELS